MPYESCYIPSKGTNPSMGPHARPACERLAGRVGFSQIHSGTILKVPAEGALKI
jgi:hypothetical protein